MNNYKDSHTFPSGLHIEYKSDTFSEYMDDRNNLNTQKDLEKFIEKWRYLFPEIVSEGLRVEEFNELRSSLKKQSEYITRSGPLPYLNLLIPTTLLECLGVTKIFKVPFGLVMLQLWNAGRFQEESDGTWVLRNN